MEQLKYFANASAIFYNRDEGLVIKHTYNKLHVIGVIPSKVVKTYGFLEGCKSFKPDYTADLEFDNLTTTASVKDKCVKASLLWDMPESVTGNFVVADKTGDDTWMLHFFTSKFTDFTDMEVWPFKFLPEAKAYCNVTGTEFEQALIDAAENNGTVVNGHFDNIDAVCYRDELARDINNDADNSTVFVNDRLDLAEITICRTGKKNLVFISGIVKEEPRSPTVGAITYDVIDVLIDADVPLDDCLYRLSTAVGAYDDGDNTHLYNNWHSFNIRIEMSDQQLQTWMEAWYSPIRRLAYTLVEELQAAMNVKDL